MCSTGSSLATEVDALAEVDVAGLPIEALMGLVEGVVGPMNRLAGVVSRAVGEIAVRGGGQVPDRAAAGAVCPSAAWLRATAGVSAHGAGRQVRTAVALRELPAVLDAVIDGAITVEHARVIARLVGVIDPAALLGSQPALIEVARRTDPDQLAHYVRHLIATWSEPALDAEEAAALDRRFLQVRDTHRGSWRGSFELPDAAMETVLTVLETLARRDSDTDRGRDTRSAGQRRADALTDVFGLALRHGELPDAGGSRPRLTYVLPAEEQATPGVDLPAMARSGRSTTGPLVDLDRHPGAACPTGAWTGPATRTQIETLLCDTRLDQLTLDPAARIVSLTSATDQITTAQRRAVAARDRCCTSKGCSRPPAFCDVHHLWALADGGPTTTENLVLLCRRHHVLWHRQQLTLADLRTPWLRLPPPRAPALE